MSDDWQVGDLALCVDDSPCSCGSCGGEPVSVVSGRTYRVLSLVRAHQLSNPSRNWIVLQFDGVVRQGYHKGQKVGANVHRFRKIRPDNHEPCEEEFAKLIKRSKVDA